MANTLPGYEQFVTLGSATVTAGGTTSPVSGTVETWTLGASSLPPASNSSTPATIFYVSDPLLPSEVIGVTNISGSTMTVVRGADGTVPVAHSSGGFAIETTVSGATLRAIQGLPPSGDVTGVTDLANIQGMAAFGGQLGFGTFKISAPLALATGQALRGCGRGTAITPGTSWAGTAMATLASTTSGSSSINVTVKDLQFNIGFQSGVKGIFFSPNGMSDPNYLIQNVTVNNAGSDSFTVTCGSGSAGSKLDNCISLGTLGVGFTLGSDVQTNNCESGLSLGHGFILQTNSITTNCKAWYTGYNPQNANWSTGNANSCGFFTSSNVVTINGCSAQQCGLHGYWLSGTAGSPLEFINMSGCEADTNAAYAAGNSLAAVGNGVQADYVLRSSITGITGANNAALTVFNGTSNVTSTQVWGIALTGQWSTAAGLPGNTFVNGNSVIGSSGTVQMPQGAPTGTGSTGTPASTIYVVNGVMAVNTLGGMTPVTAIALTSCGSLIDYMGTNDAQVNTIHRMTINGTGTQATGTATTLQFADGLSGCTVTLPASFAGAGLAFSWEVVIEYCWASVGVSGSSLLRAKITATAGTATTAAVTCVNFRNAITSVNTTLNWRMQPQAAWGTATGTPSLQSYNSYIEREGP